MNRCGTSEGGGADREVEPDCYCLAGWTSWEPWRSIYEVDMQKTTNKMREEKERAVKRRVEGKMKGRTGIYRAQSIRR